MKAMGTGLFSTLRAQRAARGLSQERLATLAGITRQSYAALEAGRSVPSTEVALRLARALSTTVEALFRLPESAVPTLDAELVGWVSAGRARVRLARVGGRLLAFPVPGKSGHRWDPADGEAEAVGEGRVRVTPVAEPPPACELVALGCDPSFGLAAEALRRERGVEVLWGHQDSRRALESLAAGRAHVVGMHLHDPATGEYNAPWIRRVVPFACTRVGYAVWEQALLVRQGNPLGIRSVADLARPGVRFLDRPAGSGSHALLDARLGEAGVPGSAIAGYGVTAATGHLAVAETIASGLADAGVGIRAAGAAFELDGVRLAEERYDLVIPDHFLDLPAVQALLDTLRSRSLRAQIDLLGGYDTSILGIPV
jgi:putative molybdopterin biosynthesis protein